MSDLCHVLRIEPHPANVRGDLGDLGELADSIRVQGILQPIVVQPKPGTSGRYVILAGHRRYAAARLAGLAEVPVVIRENAGPARAIEVMLVENCQRTDLGAVDKAEAMAALRNHGYTATKIARAVGCSVPAVAYYLSLLDLDAASLERVRAGQVSAADAVQAVRRTRQARRRKRGEKPMGAAWEPDHFGARHPLARKAAAMCEGRQHTMRRRIGKVACGQCWETVIRRDEQLVTRIAALEPELAAGGPR